MGWYFRKSVSLGPLKLNLSKRGIGVSTGVRGARIGIDAKGEPYVSAGKGGFYFSERLGKKGTPSDGKGAGAKGWLIAAIVAAALIGSVVAFR